VLSKTHYSSEVGGHLLFLFHFFFLYFLDSLSGFHAETGPGYLVFCLHIVFVAPNLHDSVDCLVGNKYHSIIESS
jgi:hypothetical protein